MATLAAEQMSVLGYAFCIIQVFKTVQTAAPVLVQDLKAITVGEPVTDKPSRHCPRATRAG